MELDAGVQRACVSLIVLLHFVVWSSCLCAQEATINQNQALFPRLAQQGQQPAIVHIDVSPAHELNAFDPDAALGSSIDVLSRLDIDKVYSPHILQESLSAGWGPISYRNNTELRMAAWHWTENGAWSDPAHLSGYFTGSTELKSPTRYILAYALPHRGFATDGDRPVQGPNLSYWKSNPYLTSKFTGESDALLQPFDARGREFMSYVAQHGTFFDVPTKFLIDEMKRLYPRLCQPGGLRGSMEEEARR